jgi:hypothetical protein
MSTTGYAYADFKHSQGDKIVLDKATFSSSGAASTAKISYDAVSGQLFYNQTRMVARLVLAVVVYFDSDWCSNDFVVQRITHLLSVSTSGESRGTQLAMRPYHLFHLYENSYYISDVYDGLRLRNIQF